MCFTYDLRKSATKITPIDGCWKGLSDFGLVNIFWMYRAQLRQAQRITTHIRPCYWKSRHICADTITLWPTDGTICAASDWAYEEAAGRHVNTATRILVRSQLHQHGSPARPSGAQPTSQKAWLIGQGSRAKLDDESTAAAGRCQRRVSADSQTIELDSWHRPATVWPQPEQCEADPRDPAQSAAG